MKSLSLLISLFSSLFLLSCTQDDTTCPYVEKVTAESTCYEPSKGLTLRASGQGQLSEGLEWQVYVSKDTTVNALDDLIIQQGGSNSLTVPDTIIHDNPKLLVKVVTTCEGEQLHSIYFSFLRKTVNNCTVWEEQRL